MNNIEAYLGFSEKFVNSDFYQFNKEGIKTTWRVATAPWLVATRARQAVNHDVAAAKETPVYTRAQQAGRTLGTFVGFLGAMAGVIGIIASYKNGNPVPLIVGGITNGSDLTYEGGRYVVNSAKSSIRDQG